MKPELINPVGNATIPMPRSAIVPLRIFPNIVTGCHMLEHEESGLMGQSEVVEQGQSISYSPSSHATISFTSAISAALVASSPRKSR